MNKILVFIPTYEELDNAGPMCEQIMSLPVELDLHFVDDASPDGTGEELDRLAARFPRVSVSHRSGKLGIGTAHQAGIAYAYERDYDFLITMDCDFTHSPEKIPALLDAIKGYQVVLGSRFLRSHSLPGWSIFRRLLTGFGHLLTHNLLIMKYDATGAFRLYDLKRISPKLFSLVRSKGYSFFFESLFILSCNGVQINEIPIALPARTAGHSKLSFSEAYRSTLFLFRLAFERMIHPDRFRIPSSTEKSPIAVKESP